jgi:release factor glutamine methyltransferase
MTVAAALSWARGKLSAAAVGSPGLTAELLLGHTLACDRVHLLTHPEQSLLPSQSDVYRSLVGRRCAGEPLQYITGEQEFFGLPFRVTPAVLIPRPETEVLVEKALGLAAVCGVARVADVGTGSGCIAVSVAVAVRSAEIWAVDLSPDALEVARHNAARHRVADRIRFVVGDMMECFHPGPFFDLILSNPPYVAAEEIAGLDPGVRDHEPHLALLGGNSGLDVVARLVQQASVRLAPGGRVLMEIGAGQSLNTTGLATAAGLLVEAVLADLSGIPRCVVARRQSEGADG